MKIDDWRRKIDAIDTAMLHLLNLRTELALEVGRFKSENGVALRVPEREQEILNRLKGINPGPLDGEAVERIYQLILDQSVRAQESSGFGAGAHAKANGKGPHEKETSGEAPSAKGSRAARGNSRRTGRA